MDKYVHTLSLSGPLLEQCLRSSTRTATFGREYAGAASVSVSGQAGLTCQECPLVIQGVLGKKESHLFGVS